MTDVYCPKCGEPCDPYEFHDTAKELQTTYADVARMFRTEGCDALPGWRCNPETNSDRAALAQAVYAISGDDMDGAAADLADVDILTPWTPPVPADHTLTMTLRPDRTAELARILGSVSVAMSTESVRAAIHQINVEMDMTAHRWTFTATDSYLLATVSAAMPEPNAHTAPPTVTWNIPGEHVKPISKALAVRDTYTTLTVHMTGSDVNQIEIQTGPTVHTIRPTTAEFPRWRALWPKDDQPYEHAAFQPARLAQLAKSAQEIAPRRDRDTLTLQTVHMNAHKPSAWKTTYESVEWSAILMPVRIR